MRAIRNASLWDPRLAPGCDPSAHAESEGGSAPKAPSADETSLRAEDRTGLLHCVTVRDNYQLTSNLAWSIFAASRQLWRCSEDELLRQ